MSKYAMRAVKLNSQVYAALEEDALADGRFPSNMANKILSEHYGIDFGIRSREEKESRTTLAKEPHARPTLYPQAQKNGVKVVNHGPDEKKLAYDPTPTPRTPAQVTSSAMNPVQEFQKAKEVQVCPHGFAKGMCKNFSCNHKNRGGAF